VALEIGAGGAEGPQTFRTFRDRFSSIERKFYLSSKLWSTSATSGSFSAKERQKTPKKKKFSNFFRFCLPQRPVLGLVWQIVLWSIYLPFAWCFYYCCTAKPWDPKALVRISLPNALKANPLIFRSMCLVFNGS
jgi:hypothetical protein